MHQTVDELAELFADVRVESLGAIERVAGLHGVVACNAERDLDLDPAGRGDERGFVELAPVDRTTEELSEPGRLAHM